MNNRIWEMIQKLNGQNGLLWTEMDKEEFGQLIIQECANYIRENYDSWDAEPLAHNMEVDFGLHGDYAE
jgi:hypothetical protein